MLSVSRGETGTNKEGNYGSRTWGLSTERVVVGRADTKRELWGRGLGQAPWGDETGEGLEDRPSISHKEHRRSGASVSLPGSPLAFALELTPVNLVLVGAEFSISLSVCVQTPRTLNSSRSFIHSLPHLFVPQTPTA